MKIVSVKMRPAGADSDAVTPSRIDHACAEIQDGDALSYFRYEFDVDSKYYWARAYLHEIDVVSIFGPFESREKLELPVANIDPRIIAYFQRRYKTILRLTANGYEPIWQAD